MPFRNSPSSETDLLLFKPDLTRGRAGIILSYTQTSFDLSSSDLTAWYTLDESDKKNEFRLKSKMGIYEVPALLSYQIEWVDFILESGEIMIRNKKDDNFLYHMLFHEKMNSAMALPLFKKGIVSDIVVLNSRNLNYYGSKKYRDLCILNEICSNILQQ